MQQPQVIEKWWFQWGSFAFLFITTILFAYTGKYMLLLAPVIFFYAILMWLNWKTAFWLLLFCVPISMAIELIPGSLSTAVPDEPLMWSFVLLFAILWSHNPKILPEWWWRNPIVMIIVLQFAWMLVAVACSEELFLSIKYTIAKAWMLIAFFVIPVLVFRSKKDFRRAFLIFLFPLLATMIVILVRHAAIGFSFIQIKKAIGIIYYNHVDYSTVMSMFFPLLLVAHSLCRGKWMLRNILKVLIVFFLVAIYLTYARAAMLAVVFSFIVYIAIRMKLVRWIMPGIYGIIALGLVLLIHNKNYLIYRPNYRQTYMHKTFTQHMIATVQGTDMSSMERVYRWIAGIRMSTDRPLTGVGPNAFYYYYKPYAVTSFRTYVSRNTEKSTAHNYFLFMLVEQGWPAMLLYAALLMVMFAEAQRTYHRFKDRFYKKCTLGIAMLLAAGFVNNFFSDLLESHKVGAMFFLGLALLVVLREKSKREEAMLKENPAAIID